MKTLFTTLLTGLSIFAILGSNATNTFAADANVQSLRGGTALNVGAPAVDLKTVMEGEQFERNYRQQPPLIPHDIADYQVDMKANQCIACHDWPQNVAVGAPKISETHYVDRNGKRLNKVSSARWFCTQCHVPQDEVEALVPNTFESSNDLE